MIQSSKDFFLGFISPVEIVKAKIWIELFCFNFCPIKHGNISTGFPVMLDKAILEISSQIQGQEFRVEWDRQEIVEGREVRQGEIFLGC